MKTHLILVLFVYFAANAESANILAIFPLPSKSHFIFFAPVVKELARRGHSVDVLSHFPLKEPIQNYQDLSLEGTLPNFVNNLTLRDVWFDNRDDLLKFMLTDCGTETCKSALSTKVLKDILNTKKKYDLLLSEVFTTDCMLGFAHKFQIPVIGMTSSVTLPWGNDRFANPDNPAYIPMYFETSGTESDVFSRLYSTVMLLYYKWTYQTLSNDVTNKIAKEFFGQDLPKVEDLAQNMSLLLVNSHFSMNQVRPTVPAFIELGGIHIEEPKPLTPHFKQLLNHPEGVIYLSMGSMVQTESFPKETLQAMLDSFAEVPQKVLWKADKALFPKGLNFPKNVHFEKWMPQMEILCSPQLKLFVSHGGLLGSQETAYCGVPRLGIPIFADQEHNIRQSVNMKLALRLGLMEINKENFSKAIKELLTNPEYRENAKKVSEWFKDRPMKPLDTAMYWVEYVLRHKGAPQLRSPATKLSWYQYHLLDVAALLIGIILAGLFTLNCLIKLLVKLLVQKKSKSD